MKKLLAGIALFGVVVPLQISLSAGCGSDNAAPSGGGGAKGFGDGGPRPDCAQTGSACATSGECCSANCDTATRQCAPPLVSGSCSPPDAACTTNIDCCTSSCVAGKCSSKQCVADNGTCGADSECCGGKCTSGKCTPLNTACKTAGNPCAGSGDCCSQFCNSGLCDGNPSFCKQNGDACSSDLDCCGGLCTKAAGAMLGVCSVAPASGAGGCTTAGTVCGPTGACNANPCCSRSCEPYAATGITICQPPSGCHPTGELCQKDSDCCGAKGSAEPQSDSVDTHCSKANGATVGRCDQGHKCSPAGSICRLALLSCEATDRCCSGTVQQVKTNCVQDNLGIPRCLVSTGVDCTNNPPPAGTACASSADCCNRPCTPDATGKLVCSGAACQPTGGSCTTTADCCSGEPCILPSGSTIGTCGASSSGPNPGATNCAQYGQQCTQASDCCNSIPCTNGFCVTPSIVR